MIVGISIAPFDSIRLLSISRFRFHLTGSRYFGYAKPDSDWDFFTQDKEGLTDYLKSKNFVRKSMKPEWMGSNTLSIWEHTKAEVEIEVERDWDLKQRAQEYIKANPAFLESLKNLPKLERGEVWENVYAILK